jgi:basic membrane protein A
VAEIKNGTYKASVFFAGLEEGFVKLAPFGENVPEDIKQQALDTVEGLRDGTIKPFDGPILDQDGEVRFAEGVSPSDEELQTIDWLVDGIQGSVG